MSEYLVRIKYEGVKTYVIEAEDFEQAVEIAKKGPEHQTNEIDDTVSEEILLVEYQRG